MVDKRLGVTMPLAADLELQPGQLVQPDLFVLPPGPRFDDWEDAPIKTVEDSHVKTRYGHPYILRDYCRPSRVQVRECEVVGMGHAWSGGDSALPYHDELGPDASALMVEFFASVKTESSVAEVARTVH